MKKWILLGAAISFELVGTLSLRASQNHVTWLILAALGYVCAFVGLTLVLRTGLAIGVAYGIWGAVATAATAALAAAFFDESLTWSTVGGIALIIVGVMFVELGSHSQEEQPT